MGRSDDITEEQINKQRHKGGFKKMNQINMQRATIISILLKQFVGQEFV